MTRIRVTPEELIHAAQQMADIGGRIRQVAGELSSVLNGLDPRAYDGQLYGKVAGRVSSAQGAAQGPASKTATHAADLNERAQAFTDTDLFSVTHVAAVSAQLRNPTGTRNSFVGWAAWLIFPKGIFDWLGLGNLLGGGDGDEIPSPSVTPPNNVPTGPQPRSRPVPIPLNPGVDLKDYSATDGCVLYAQKRRKDLDYAPDDKAENYINRTDFKDKVFQITDETDLTTRIAVGYALVWRHDHPDLAGTAGATYGHVAIVEEVGPDYVWVSQAGWGSETRKKISIDKLKSLYIIP